MFLLDGLHLFVVDSGLGLPCSWQPKVAPQHYPRGDWICTDWKLMNKFVLQELTEMMHDAWCLMFDAWYLMLDEKRYAAGACRDRGNSSWIKSPSSALAFGRHLSPYLGDNIHWRGQHIWFGWILCQFPLLIDLTVVFQRSFYPLEIWTCLPQVSRAFFISVIIHFFVSKAPAWLGWVSNWSARLLPRYQLGLDMKSNGFLSAAPMLARYIGGILLCRLADWLVR